MKTSSGITWSAAAGASVPVSSRLVFVADASYTPLFVRRLTDGPRTNDGLFNVRGLISYRIR